MRSKRLRNSCAHKPLAERQAAERQLFELECGEAALEQLDQKTYLLSVVPAGIRRMEEVPGWVGSAPDEMTQSPHPLAQDPLPGETSARHRVPRRERTRRLAA
jgi:hypothetical protein